MGRRAIILDFDGTIADSEQVIIDIYNNFSDKQKWPKLTHADYVRLRDASPKEAMKWAGIKFWQVPRLLKVGRSEYKKHRSDIKLFPDMAETIRGLARSGSEIYVLSSNSKETVESVLATHNLNQQVVILKGSPIFKKDKVLKRLLKDKGYFASDSWMIGDEIRDIEAANKVGMKSIGVTWGLQSQTALKSAGPTFIVKTPKDITRVLGGKKL
jgi:phosphoglycolate phosphatase-like HAD superfamily hydrolase